MRELFRDARGAKPLVLKQGPQGNTNHHGSVRNCVRREIWRLSTTRQRSAIIQTLMLDMSVPEHANDVSI